jgi:hypothetical protein
LAGFIKGTSHTTPPPAAEGGDLVHRIVGGGHGLGGGSGLGAEGAGAVASGIIGESMAGAQASGEIFFNDRGKLAGEVVGEGPLVLVGRAGIGERGFAFRVMFRRTRCLWSKFPKAIFRRARYAQLLNFKTTPLLKGELAKVVIRNNQPK